jgi:uncharacterized protein YjeT (DUF2065 family)
MTDFSTTVLSTASAFIIIGLILLLFPRSSSKAVKKLPRNKIVGGVLTAIDIIWLTVLLLNCNIKWISDKPVLILILAPVVFLLIIFLVDELLGARAIGGLFLLLPYPMLSSTFLHVSAGAILINITAYILVILGMIWMWSPFMFRKMTSHCVKSPGTTRLYGSSAAALGIIILWIAIV